MRFSYAPMALAALVAAGGLAWAKDAPPAPPPVQVYHAIARGSLAFVAQTGALVIHDMADPGNPRMLGKLGRPGQVQAVALEGEYVYVAAGTRGAQAIDVSRPEEPRLVGAYDSVGAVRDVVVHGTVAAIADDARGLEIVSFADPAHPHSLATLPSRDVARGVSWEGALLASTEGNAGVRLFDMTHPATPVRLGQLERPLPALGAAVCDGDLVLVAAGKAGLHAWNVSDPARPVAAGSITGLGRVQSVSCEGKLAALGCGDHGIVLVDLSSAGAPRVVGKAPRPGGYPAERVFLAGKLVLVATGSGGLGVVSIDDPAAPVTLLPRARKMSIRFP